MNPDLAFALALADAADRITMSFFRRHELSVRTKSDRSPVSEADEAVERMLRETIQRERPGDDIVGEEFGTTGLGRRRWVVDPIDGTRNYVRGVPVFATLIALEEDAVPRVGVVSAPAMTMRWWASRGEGSHRDGSRIKVSNVATIENSFLGYDSVTDFDTAGSGEKFLKLARSCDRTRGFGDFWAHMLVAEGAIDVAIEPRVAHWDMSAIQVIVEEAGGRFSTLGGEVRADGGSAVSSNGRIHDAVLEMMR